MSQCAVSVVIPAKNEAENLPKLLDEVCAALRDTDFEVLVVDDGSTDSTLAVLARYRDAGCGKLRILRHARSLGQSTSVYHAVWAARSPWIATLDGDGQNDPADIPAMLALAQRQAGENVKLVAGHRVKRQDTLSKRYASRFANALRSRMLRDNTPDTGCGLKVFDRAMFLSLPYFDHMHRFLPALVQRHGGRVVNHPVNHRYRMAGVSKYGNLDRALVGILDLLGVWWLIRRTRLDVPADEH